jgi:hypothetical protein
MILQDDGLLDGVYRMDFDIVIGPVKQIDDHLQRSTLPCNRSVKASAKEGFHLGKADQPFLALGGIGRLGYAARCQDQNRWGNVRLPVVPGAD